VRWFFAHCILSMIERNDIKFFSCCENIYWVRARFKSFSANGEYAECLKISVQEVVLSLGY
jgi:hypothetical protein